MTTPEIATHSIASLARSIARRELSPVDVVAALLERIERLDPALNAYITVAAEQAMAAAREAEREIASGRHRGPLHGVPVAHKDVLLTRGMRTTAHSRTLEDFVPDEDAAAVERLTEAGAVLLGKLNTYEFACGGTERFGVPVNPWDPTRTTGGSSAGAGAAVAAGMCFGATGTDTGGSIRAPASYCGVVGLKPSYGRVSRHGVFALSWSLDHVGPMARTAKDAAILLDAMAGFDPRDPSSSRTRSGSFAEAAGGLDPDGVPEVAGLTLGVPRDRFGASISADVAAAVETAIAELERAGATIRTVDLPSATHSLTACFAIMCPEATLAHEARLRSRGEQYAAITRQTLLLGACLDGMDYLRAQRARHAMYREIEDVLRDVDALVWPSMHQCAPKVSEPESWAALQTQLSNLTGHPSVSVPCGFSSSGLPVGLLVTGRMMDDATVLRVAAAYQGVTDWHETAPRIDEHHRPPDSKPYAFASLVGQANEGEREQLVDHVVGCLRRRGLPVIDSDIEPLASTLRFVRLGLATIGDDVDEHIEPLVHQHIEHVPTP